MKNNYILNYSARIVNARAIPAFNILAGLMLSLLIHQSAAAQTAGNTQAIAGEMMVTGLVVDSKDNSPMYSVNVLLKGTSEGTATDEAGRFIFPRNLKVNDTLVFSFIGYTAQEYVVTEKDRNNPISIALVFSADILGDAAEDGVYQRKHGVRAWFKKGTN